MLRVRATLFLARACARDMRGTCQEFAAAVRRASSSALLPFEEMLRGQVSRQRHAAHARHVMPACRYGVADRAASGSYGPFRAVAVVARCGSAAVRQEVSAFAGVSGDAPSARRAAMLLPLAA